MVGFERLPIRWHADSPRRKLAVVRDPLMLPLGRTRRNGYNISMREP
jgi:hypothetical protein